VPIFTFDAPPQKPTAPPKEPEARMLICTLLPEDTGVRCSACGHPYGAAHRKEYTRS
jgi:hypothetical protein